MFNMVNGGYDQCSLLLISIERKRPQYGTFTTFHGVNTLLSCKVQAFNGLTLGLKKFLNIEF